MQILLAILIVSAVILLGAIIWVLYFWVNKNYIPTDRFYSYESNDIAIPKIIHQTAPRDRSKWPAKWNKCYKTVQEVFPKPEYQHVLWTDEDNEAFVKEHYPQYYDLYINYPYKINRIDIIRCMILHKYGGIYLDMDYYVEKNFYDTLIPGRIHLLASIFPWNEIYQNSLMASPPGEQFWLDCVDLSLKGFMDRIHHDKILKKGKVIYVLSMTGPRLLDAIARRTTTKTKIKPLSYLDYGYGKYAKHLYSGAWGVSQDK